MKTTTKPAFLAFILLLAAASTLGAQFRAASAKVDITPPLGSRMYGYGARGDNVSRGVHDPLFAKALVLTDDRETFAIVTVDLGSFGKPYAKAVTAIVQRATGIEHVFVIASHTHSGPVFDESFPSDAQPWLRELESEVADAVIQAHKKLAPARIAVGSSKFDSCHNRRNVHEDGTVEMRWVNRKGLPTDPVDTTVSVIGVDTADGQPIATLVSYACHPVVLGPENLQISADYPGAMMALVEDEIGGEVLFAQGAAGDLNPFWDKTPLAEGAFSEMERHGRGLGHAVLRVRRELQGVDPGTLSVERQSIPLQPRWDLEDPKVREAFEANEFGWIFEIYRGRFRREREAEINTVVVGNVLAFATFPGEFFVEHQMRLREGSMLPNTLFFGYCNGELGYFPTIRAAAEGGYGGKEATIVEVGAGEMLVSRALVRLHHQAGKLHRVPQFQ